MYNLVTFTKDVILILSVLLFTREIYFSYDPKLAFFTFVSYKKNVF